MTHANESCLEGQGGGVLSENGYDVSEPGPPTPCLVQMPELWFKTICNSCWECALVVWLLYSTKSYMEGALVSEPAIKGKSHRHQIAGLGKKLII